MNKKVFSICVLFFLISTVALAQDLKESIDNILKDEKLTHAEVGISVVDDAGRTLYDKNAQMNMIPASLQKIITNFTILDEKGENYTYETKVGYTGEILDDGTLSGDIIIYGNGDPSLGSERYKKRPQIGDVVNTIMSIIQKAGIRCIDGHIITDASFYGSNGTIGSWSWIDLGNYYACNTWSLNLHENYYNLYFQLNKDQKSGPKVIRHSPEIPGLVFENDLESGPPGSGDQAYIYGGPYGYKKYIRGSLPVGNKSYRIKGAIPDAPLYLAQLVSHNLSLKNISNQGPKTHYSSPIKVDKWIGNLPSPRLSDLVESANLSSINLYCESFLMTAGNGSKRKGIHKVYEFLNEMGIDSAGIHVEDGSGLSAWNNISAEDFTKVLRKLVAQYGSDLCPYFPEAGKTGTLSYMFRNLEANGKLWAKTGSMQQVMNYAGFTKAKSGKWVSFCIMINRHDVSNREIRKIEEQIMNLIYLKA